MNMTSTQSGFTCRVLNYACEYPVKNERERTATNTITTVVYSQGFCLAHNGSTFRASVDFHDSVRTRIPEEAFGELGSTDRELIFYHPF